ncbi:Cytochrome c-552 [Burkholderiales bacterium]|nr:Cytochrome c-552 [Burkholderiales bacterium]
MARASKSCPDRHTIRDPKTPKLDDTNSIPCDAAKIKEGDLLPGFILNTKQDGSAADLNANGKWENGAWTMVVWRKLNTGQKDDIALAAGQTYPVGFAVHDDSFTTRFHYVSMPLKLSLGKKDGHVNAIEIK